MKKIAVLGSKFLFNQLSDITSSMNLYHISEICHAQGGEFSDIIYLSNWKKEYKNPYELERLVKTRIR